MNAQTLFATAAFAAIALHHHQAQACNICDMPLVESFATVELTGGYIDLKPIGVVETDSSGFVGLKPIGYLATGSDGSVSLKPIGSEVATETYEFDWTVDPADVSISFRTVSDDLAGLKPIGIIEVDDNDLVGLKPIGIYETDSSGYTDLKPIGLDYQDDEAIELDLLGSEDSVDLAGLKPIGTVATDADGYIDLEDVGSIEVETSGAVEVPSSTTSSSQVIDASNYYTAEYLLSRYTR